ncbi:hypothetical protein RRG08_050200 [Elysia crispata]|uniref:Uncharacterized protein n=1 Tax=Elysia crispata TaxID=231223 RepID=A0AAE0Z7P7_9GAST|nr:hypothetical protein RRG08_050200 [Elysia crispata]
MHGPRTCARCHYGNLYWRRARTRCTRVAKINRNIVEIPTSHASQHDSQETPRRHGIAISKYATIKQWQKGILIQKVSRGKITIKGSPLVATV